MSHYKFLANLNKIYKDITCYGKMIENHRLDLLLSILADDKDFRYLLPLYTLPDFMFAHFKNLVFHKDTTWANTFTYLYQRVKYTAHLINRSVNSRTSLANYHRTYPIQVDIKALAQQIDECDNIITYPPNDFKLQSEFFYEELPHFNGIGPLHRAIKDKIKPWSSLPIQERKINDYNCLIEYYIYKKSFPIEGKFIKDNMKKNWMFLNPSLDGLRAALKTGNSELIGYNISAYDQLPVTIKRTYLKLISSNYDILKQFTKKQDLPYLNKWRLYAHENKESNSSISI